MTKSVKYLLESEKVDADVLLQGWLRNKRISKNVAFFNINDGSTIQNIQAVADVEQLGEDFLKGIGIGAGIKVEGKLIESQGSGQRVEVNINQITVLGNASPEYPIQPKKHSFEYLREKAHLRTRTSTFGAIFRVRHGLSFAVHKYFHENGFFHWHTPIITASDAEGAGETFRVSILPPQNPPLSEDEKVNFKEDFFGKETNLTVSGQLEAELGALGLGKVYTFGPTFRAENSNTARHLAEFWMIEPEMAFYDAEDNANLAEDCLKYLIRYALEEYSEDMEFLDFRFVKENSQKPKDQRSEMGLLEKLNFVVENDFERITYTEAIRVLMNSKPYKKKKFKFPVDWGIDLQSEHERFLVEKHFKKPVIVSDYPKKIKAFYMKHNEGEEEGRETVRAMDVLAPGIGEIIGGSQREEVYEKLKERTDKLGISEELWWYLETRKFGTVPHSGFGLGFERLVQFVTGMGNIRDVIPFPRTPQNAEF